MCLPPEGTAYNRILKTGRLTLTVEENPFSFVDDSYLVGCIRGRGDD